MWVGENGRTITYNYDAASQLTSVSDPNSSYTYNYDLAGRLTRVDNEGTANIPRVVLSYSYDKVGNMVQVTDSLGGTESFSYDNLNRVVQITQTGTGVVDKRVDLSYNAASQMTGIVRYSDLAGNELVVESNYEYDGIGRLINLTHSRNSLILANYGWIYDNAHRVTRFTSPDGISNYTYDDRGQLLAGDHDYQSDESYSYDDHGNITNTGYVTGANNRLLSDGVYNYTYDAEGNRIQRTAIATGEVTSYEWDFRNRITKVVTLDSDGNIVKRMEYAYDVFDRRIGKSLDGAISEVFVYDGDHIALVFDGDGELTQRNFHGPLIDQILAIEGAGSQVQWGLGDNLGTIRIVVNADGVVVNRIVYDSFGEVVSESNPGVDFRYGFTGRELDLETGLVYYRARYYDGGRFISEDPIGFGGGDGNLYRYVFNSPTNFTDPSGNIAVAPVVVGGIVIPIIADLIFPDGVQAPTSPCDNQPNLDKSLERGLLELGLGFSTDLLFSPQFWRGLGGLGDDLLKGLDNLFGPPPGLDFVPVGPNLGDDLLRGGSGLGGPLSGPGTQAGAGGALGGRLGDLNRPLESSSGSGDPLPEIIIDRNKYPETGQHIEDAQAAGHPDVITIDRNKSRTRQRRKDSLRNHSRQPGTDRDEYPPAISREGGQGASVRNIDPSDNRGAGASMGNQMRNLPDETRVRIKVE